MRILKWAHLSSSFARLTFYGHRPEGTIAENRLFLGKNGYFVPHISTKILKIYRLGAFSMLLVIPEVGTGLL